MKAAKNITFEDYLYKIYNKDATKILLGLIPILSHPSQSRFHKLFKKQNEFQDYPENKIDNKNNKETAKKKKKKLEINLNNIENGIDKRTSLMIKNIPKEFEDTEVIKWLHQLVRLNYIFVPKDECSNKILGFAFINVCEYTDILVLFEKLSLLEKSNNNTNNNNKKKIEVIYCHKQGIKSLTKLFGASNNY